MIRTSPNIAYQIEVQETYKSQLIAPIIVSTLNEYETIPYYAFHIFLVYSHKDRAFTNDRSLFPEWKTPGFRMVLSFVIVNSVVAKIL